MKLRKQILLSLLSFVLLPAATAFAQLGNTTTLIFPGVPTGKCQPLQLGLNKANGNLYSCFNGAWVLPPTGANGFPVTAPQNVSTGGSISPTGVGQIFGTGMTLFTGVPYVAASITSTSGGFLGGAGFNYQIVYNTAAGETYPSAVQSLNMSTCGGSACQVTIVAPLLPSGVTGYTAYDCNTSSSCTPLRQASGPACVNITTNCVVLSGGAGAALPTQNTAWFQPANVATNACPPGVIPQWFGMDSALNYQTLAGLDEFSDGTNGPPSPGGWLTFCRRVVISDTQQSPPVMKNALFNVNHIFSSTNPNTVLTNQDRAVGIQAFNLSTDAAAHYSFAGLQDEVDLNGTPTFSAHIDGEVSAGSFQVADAHTNAIASGPALGINGVRSTVNRQAAGTIGGCPNGDCYIGVQATAFNNNASAISAGFVGVMTTVTDGTGGSGANAIGRGVHVITPGAARLGGNNYGVDIQDYGINANDFNFISESSTPTRGKNYFLGALVFGSGNNSPSNGTWWATTHKGTGSLTTIGALGTSAQLAAPPAPTLSTQGSAGATSYTYALVAFDGNNNPAPGPTTTKATGNATLGAGNNILVQWASNSVPGVDHWGIYRTASAGTPSSTGLIGSVTIMCPPEPGGGVGLGCPTTISFTDTGLAGDSSTLPVSNQTAQISGFKHETMTNCGSAGSAANPSLVACGSASAGSFSCSPTASGGTCVVSTTAVTKNSEILITQRTDTTTGTRLGVTCNTGVSTVLPVVTAVSDGVSFTINLGTITTNPECLSYHIVN